MALYVPAVPMGMAREHQYGWHLSVLALQDDQRRQSKGSVRKSRLSDGIKPLTKGGKNRGLLVGAKINGVTNRTLPDRRTTKAYARGIKMIGFSDDDEPKPAGPDWTPPELLASRLTAWRRGLPPMNEQKMRELASYHVGLWMGTVSRERNLTPAELAHALTVLIREATERCIQCVEEMDGRS